MPVTKYMTNQFANLLAGRNTSISLSNGVYLGLATAAPEFSGDNVSNLHELSGNGYARVLVGYPSQSYTWAFGSSASGGSISNTKQIKFDMSSGAWSTATHGLLFDGSGNLLGWGELDSSITVGANEVAVVPVGGLTIQFLDQSAE